MRGERDKKRVGLELAGDPESRLKGAPPRLRKQFHQLGHRVNELMEPGKRQLRLRLHPHRPQRPDAQCTRTLPCVPQQRRLADARLPPHEQRTARLVQAI